MLAMVNGNANGYERNTTILIIGSGNYPGSSMASLRPIGTFSTLLYADIISQALAHSLQKVSSKLHCPTNL